MDITLVTIAFNGYGRFLGQFLAYASNLSPKPKEVIIVLGKDHGCEDIELMELVYPGVKIIKYNKEPTFGKLRNIGIGKAETEWIWYIDIDDQPMPDAIETFSRVSDNADYICSQWDTVGLGFPRVTHYSPTPKEMAERVASGTRGGFIVPHSPFKKELWEKSPYKDKDLSNYNFLLNCVLNGARFVKGDKPTTTYLRRSTSHARTTLLTIKDAARKQRRIMQRGMIEYYKEEK